MALPGRRRCAAHRSLVVFAPTPQAAARVAEKLRSYEKPDTEHTPGFRLVSLRPHGPETEYIKMQAGGSMNEAELVLHYGDDFVKWVRAFLAERHMGGMFFHVQLAKHLARAGSMLRVSSSPSNSHQTQGTQV